MKIRIKEGVVKRHPDGFGFFMDESANPIEVYIPRHEMVGVMNNDRVVIEIQPEGKNRYRGRVIRIVKRAVSQVIGRLQIRSNNRWILPDDSGTWGAELQLNNSEQFKDQTKLGDLVVAHIVTYPESGQSFTGQIQSVLGNIQDPQTDTQRVLHSQGIPTEFSTATLKEAAQLPKEVQISEFKHRKDLRQLHFVTIDGATAKDFDDAIYVESRKAGFNLWVAIADVSHYVKQNSAIDKDAYIRGTSVYFPQYVVPMLPEQLSNELCSLKPHVPRLALVCELAISFTGETQNAQFYEALIESKARLTYGEAQEMMESKTELRIAADLAKLLLAKRLREGSLELEIPEVQIALDASGQPVDFVKTDRLFSHRLIEELMLAANVATATFFEKNQIPALYRVHEAPSPDSLEMLQRFLWNFGSRQNLTGGKLQKRLTQALGGIKTPAAQGILNILTLRSMKQAKYSAENIGHFGLAFKNYTHFTSPIRRYPDLIVHRLVKSLLKIPGYRLTSEANLVQAATVLSGCEQRAVKAERQFLAIKKARFMEKHLNECFSGTISGIAKFGIFVMLKNIEVDGLIKIETLGPERFDFDETHLTLTGARSGTVFEIGQTIEIRVVQADIENGQITFERVQAEDNHVKLVREGQTDRADGTKRSKTSSHHRSFRKARFSKPRRKD